MHYIPKFEARFLPNEITSGSAELQEIIQWVTSYNTDYFVDTIMKLDHGGTGAVSALMVNLRGGCEEVAYWSVDQYLILGLNYAEVVSRSDLNKYFIGLAD